MCLPAVSCACLPFSTFPYLDRSSTLDCAAGRRRYLTTPLSRSPFLHRRDLMDDKNEKGKEKDGSSSAPAQPRKGGLKFKPKVTPKKALKSVPKMEPEEESVLDKIDKDLLMILRTPQSTGALETRSKADKNEPRVEVAFGQVNSSIARSFPSPKSSLSVKQEMVDLFSEYMMPDVTTSAAKLPKKSAGPQDFTHPDYNYPPITFPLRRPYSGDPVFDEDDFGEFSSSRTQDGELTASKELGLMAESVAEADMDISEDVQTDGFQSEENYKKRRLESIRGCKLKDLPGGLMGKILVYKSGKVKMRLGDALFDVSAGLNCSFAQEAVAINTNKKHCCSLGQVNKRAIVTPDIEYLVDSVKRID